MSKSDRQFWKDYGIDPGVPSDGSLTTEQLMECAIKTVQQMSPQERADVRQELDAAFGNQVRKRLADGTWIN
jgi:hypothetical protein